MNSQIYSLSDIFSQVKVVFTSAPLHCVMYLREGIKISWPLIAPEINNTPHCQKVTNLTCFLFLPILAKSARLPRRTL